MSDGPIKKTTGGFISVNHSDAIKNNWEAIKKIMKYRLSIEIPGLPKTVNELGRKHWAVKVRHNNLWHLAISCAIKEKKLIPNKPLAKAEVILTRVSAREPDFDNLVNSFKCIQDSLIKCGVLEDDNPRVIGVPTYAWEKCKPKEGRIRIEVMG